MIPPARNNAPSAKVFRVECVEETHSELQLLLRSADAARALAISPRTLWELSKRGEIPTVRFGRVVRYDIEDLRKWILVKKEASDC